MNTRVLALLTAIAVSVIGAGCGSTTTESTPAGSTSAASSEATVAAASEATASSESAAAPATEAAAPTEPLKAAWIYVGPHDDNGWSQAHDVGRQYVQDQLGDAVVTTYKENVPEGPEVAQVIEDLIADGNKIIFATSFGYQDAMFDAAAKHPDVKFEMATGFKTADNMAVFFGAGEDSLYLAGMTAGAATKSGTVGMVVPFAIPEVIRHANAFALGVQRINPDAKVKLVWTNSWFDPAKETKAAESLVSAGADVLAQGVDGPATGQVAQKKGVKWVGYDSDASSFAPDQWLTATVYNWGPYELGRAKAVMDGTWTSGSYYGGLGDGFTDLAPLGASVTPEMAAEIDKVKAQIVSGEFYPLTGPLLDQAGKERVPEGTKMTLDEILSMDWLVKGIEGSATGG